MSSPFEDVADQRTVVVTTHRRDGSPVPTPVHIAVHGDHAYFRTWSTSGKAKRLGRDPFLEIAPSTFRGKPTGPETTAVARMLFGNESVAAAARLAHKYPLLHGHVIPWLHRRRHYETVQYELTAASRRHASGERW